MRTVVVSKAVPAAGKIILYLHGRGDTVIMKMVLPERGSPIALRVCYLCDFPKCGKLGCIICGSGGLRARFPLATMVSKIELFSTVVWSFPGDS